MSSSKIQEYNLDPNMGLAKESSVQQILSAVAVGGGGVKKIQRGTATSAGTITIEEVVMEKTMVLSVSKGSAGTVAATGTLSMKQATISGTLSAGSKGSLGFGSGSTSISGTLAAHTGTLSGGTTDLTVKEYSAVLTSPTTLTCDGACEWQVIEFC